MQNNKPLISIILPLFNAQKYIKDCIKSVIDQTYSNWELIIVDDASTDGSLNIVRRLMLKDSRIKLIKCKENFGGPAKPRNIGIKKSKGLYVAFLDNDDIWLPEKLKKQMEIFFKKKEVDIIYSLAYTIDVNGKRIGSHNNQKIFNVLKYFLSKTNILFISNFIVTPSVIMKKNADIEFREDIHLISFEDWTFWIDNCLKKKKFYLLNEKLINYRIRPDSLIGRGGDKPLKKTYYMYSKYLNEMKISISFFILLFIKNTINLFVKKIYQVFK